MVSVASIVLWMCDLNCLCLCMRECLFVVPFKLRFICTVYHKLVCFFYMLFLFFNLFDFILTLHCRLFQNCSVQNFALCFYFCYIYPCTTCTFVAYQKFKSFVCAQCPYNLYILCSNFKLPFNVWIDNKEV